MLAAEEQNEQDEEDFVCKFEEENLILKPPVFMYFQVAADVTVHSPVIWKSSLYSHSGQEEG